MKYITTPPKLADVPPFIAKRYGLFDKTFVDELIAWSNKEYFDTITYFYSNGETDKAKALESKYSNVDFIAHCNTFKLILKHMTEDIWNGLDRRTRNVLIRAKEVCENT